MKDISDSAYIYRMFELFFAIQNKEVFGHLTAKEKIVVNEFITFFKALPWKPLKSHPHISELENVSINVLAPVAKKLDHLLWLRTGKGIYPLLYRVAHGWPLFEPSRPKQQAKATNI